MNGKCMKRLSDTSHRRSHLYKNQIGKDMRFIKHIIHRGILKKLPMKMARSVNILRLPYTLFD